MNAKALQALYLDYVNNFLSYDAFALHYGFTKMEAMRLIAVLGDMHERIVADHIVQGF